MYSESRFPAGVVIGFAAVLALVIYVASLTDMLGRGFDDGQYAMLARSLAEGAGFSQLSLVGQPPEGRYPFGFPLLLAPVWWLPLDLAGRVYALKMVSVLASLFSAGVGYVFLTRRSYAGTFTAVFIIVLTMFNPLVFLYSREVFSEMPYLALSFLALFSLEAYADEDGPFRPLSFDLMDYRLWLSLLFVVAAFYTRSIGISLVVAGVFYLASRGAWRRAMVFGTGCGILILPWLIRGQLALGSSNMGYFSQFLQRSLDDEIGTASFVDITQRVVENLRDYLFGGIPGALFPSVSPYTWLNLPDELKIHAPMLVGTLLITVLVLVSFLIGLIFKRRLLDFYIAIYLFICILWPWEPTRFLVPLIPFLYLYFAQPFIDVSRLFRWNVVRPVRGLACVLVGGYLLLTVYGEFRFVQTTRAANEGPAVSQGDLWQETLSTYRWVREKTPDNAVILAVNDAQAFYYTRRKVAPALDSAEKMLEMKADYVLEIPFPTLRTGKDLTIEKFGPVQARYPEAFKEEYRSENGTIRVYRVQQDVLAGKLSR